MLRSTNFVDKLAVSLLCATTSVALLTTEPVERQHHPDSPSSLQASEACPCFQNEQRESAASLRGTLLHKATETRDLGLLGGDQELEHGAGLAIAYEEAIIAQFKATGKPFTIVREVKLAVGSDAITAGFPDTLIVGETHAALLDWKFGAVPVPFTAINLQGMAYAEGAFEKYPGLLTVEVHFYAPYQKWSAEAQRKQYVFTFHRKDRAVRELRIRTVIARKHEAAQQLVRNNWDMAAPKHDLCLWCARKGVCPKVQALVIQAHSKYHDLEVPPAMKEWKISSPEAVAAAYKFANQLEPICAAIKKRCIEAAVIEDLKPENFIIVKSAHRRIKNVAAFLTVAEEHGVPLTEATEMLSVSFKPFEDYLKAHAAKGKGASKLRAFNATLEENGVTELGTSFYFLREVKTPAEVQAIDV